MPITFLGVFLCDVCHRKIPFTETFHHAEHIGAFGSTQLIILCWGCDRQNSFSNRFGFEAELRKA